MGASVRDGGRTALPPMRSAVNVVREFRKLYEIEIEIRGGRMGANVREGGRTALPELRPAANVSSKDWEFRRKYN